MKPRFHPLFQKATDLPAGGGGSGAAATETSPDAGKEGGEKDETDEEEEEEDGKDVNASEPATLGFLDRGKLLMSSKGALVNRIAALTGQLTTANGRIAQLEAQLATANGASNRVTELEAELAAAQANTKTVEKGVQAELAKVGINAETAPGQVSADSAPDALLDKFATLKGAEKIAFYRKHEPALKAAEAARKN